MYICYVRPRVRSYGENINRFCFGAANTSVEPILFIQFRDALIEILRKYGLAGMGLLGAGMMYDNGQEEQVY